MGAGEEQRTAASCVRVSSASCPRSESQRFMVRTQETKQMEKNKVVSAMETQEGVRTECLGPVGVASVWGPAS